jgi:hypothetical protein
VSVEIPGVKAKGKEVASAIRDIVDEFQRVDRPEKAYLNEFESALANWVKETVKGNKRLVIFIDDLDRCMPEIALQVLEALKLYLNIEKLIFVVGVDRTVVDKLVKEHYKKLGLDEKKSGNYLAKMFQVEVQVEPSEQQISHFLDDQLKEISYWRDPHLSEGQRGIFVRKILDDRHTMGLLVGSERGNEFFRQWSQIVCEGRKKDKDFPCTVKVPEDYYKQFAEAQQDRSKGSLEEVSEKMKIRAALEKPSFAPKAYHPLLQNPRFSGLLHLLADEDLGQLMRIPYPAEAEAAEIAAVVGTSKDADIIREAIARSWQKKPDELTDEDYREIIVLDLSGSEISDLEPMKGLRSLQSLHLRRTQVSNLEPIKGLSSLERLDLGGTEVSDLEPIKGLSSLQSLDLGNTKVSNLEPIKALSSLQRLYLRGTQVSDLEPINGLRSLRLLFLEGTWVADKQVEELQKALPKLNISR